jgi:hypothetical protein
MKIDGPMPWRSPRFQAAEASLAWAQPYVVLDAAERSDCVVCACADRASAELIALALNRLMMQEKS